MATEESDATKDLRHADFSARSAAELSAAERAELNRRYDSFMRHFRAGKLAVAPPSAMARRIRKWHP